MKGAWTAEEDAVLRSMVEECGLGNVKWSEIAAQLPGASCGAAWPRRTDAADRMRRVRGAGRLGKQCRERWFNHLDPSINKGPWTHAEDHLLVEAQQLLGNKCAPRRSKGGWAAGG